MNLLGRIARPLDLDFRDEFIYDATDGRFYDERGPVTAIEILDYVYAYHLRTLRRGFRAKWVVLGLIRSGVRQAVLRGHDWCLWILEHGYEITSTVPAERRFLHKYRLTDFKRAQPSGPTHFFGLQSSRQSLLPNLLVFVGACAVVYWWFRDVGLVRAVYRNVALSTVFLVLGYLLLDRAIPFVLQASVVVLSRFRLAVFFLLSKVRA